MELKVCFLGAVRRRTFICCRNIQISTSSAVRDRDRSATIQTMSLTRSLIPQEHRPILDQLPVRLSIRQSQALCSQGQTIGGLLGQEPCPPRRRRSRQRDKFLGEVVKPIHSKAMPAILTTDEE